jgi:hypothetical protein
VDASPIRLGVAAMALLGSGVLVQLRLEIAVGDGLRQRPVKTGRFETRDRLAYLALLDAARASLGQRTSGLVEQEASKER